MNAWWKWLLTGRDTLDTTTTRKTPDSGLGNTLDVVTKNLAVALGTTLAETLAALSACKVDALVIARVFGSVKVKMQGMGCFIG